MKSIPITAEAEDPIQSKIAAQRKPQDKANGKKKRKSLGEVLYPAPPGALEAAGGYEK